MKWACWLVKLFYGVFDRRIDDRGHLGGRKRGRRWAEDLLRRAFSR